MNIGITCRKAVDYISKKEEGKISLWQRIQLARHLAVCSLCKRFAHQNSIIAEMFKNSEHSAHLTDDEKTKIINSVPGKQR
jgi:hypothetical protein